MGMERVLLMEFLVSFLMGSFSSSYLELTLTFSSSLLMLSQVITLGLPISPSSGTIKNWENVPFT